MQSTYDIVCDMRDNPAIESVGYYTDKHGNLTETRIDFVDDTIILVGDEYDDGGNIDGFTYSRYDSLDHYNAGEETETHGGRDTADFADIINEKTSGA